MCVGTAHFKPAGNSPSSGTAVPQGAQDPAQDWRQMWRQPVLTVISVKVSHSQV